VSPRSRRAFSRGRAAALTAGVTTALIAFLPAASAAPGLHLDWEPVVAGASAETTPSTGARSGAGGTRQGAATDPDLLAVRPSSGGGSGSEGDALRGGDLGGSDGGGHDVDPRSSSADRDGSSLFGRSEPGTGPVSPLAASGIPSTAIEAYTRAAAAHTDCSIT